MSNKYITLEYLTQNNINPDGIEFKGIFGNRSIGKTHATMKHLFNKTRTNKDMAILILRRNIREMDFAPFVQKYSEAFNVNWKIEGDTIVEYPKPDPHAIVGRKKVKEVGRIIAYLNCLSMSERGKHNNYDAPYVTDILFDEAYAENPNEKEYTQLQTWITTVSRRTGVPFHPVTVWLLGNNEYGTSPIMENLGVFPMNGLKQKNEHGVFLFSTMESPANVINVKSPYIKKVNIREGNQPVVTWSYLKSCYGLYDCGYFMYIKQIKKANRTYDYEVKEIILKSIMKKKSINPVFADNYNSLRFIELPSSRGY